MFDDVVKLYGLMKKKQIPLTVRTFVPLIEIMLISRNYIGLRKIFKDMKKANVPANEAMYSRIFSSFLKNDQLVLAEQLFDEMKENKIELNVIHYSSLIDVYMKKNEVEKGLLLFNEMKTKSIKPNIITYSSIIQNLLQNEKINEAVEYFQEMKKELPIEISPEQYYIIIEGLLDNHLSKLATQFFDELQAYDFTKDEYYYNCIIRVYVYNGNTKYFRDLYREMQIRGNKPSLVTFRYLIIGSIMKRNSSDLRYFYYEFISNYEIIHKLSTFNMILECLVKHDYLSFAYQVYEDINETKKVLPDQQTFDILLDNLAPHIVYIDYAYEVFQDMKIFDYKPSAFQYVSLICTFLKKNRKLAISLLDELKKNESLYQKLDVNFFNSLIESFFAKSFPSICKQLFQDMLENKVSPDIKTYRLLISGFSKNSLIDDAVSVFQDLKSSENLQPDDLCYLALIDGLTENNKEKQAKELKEEFNQLKGQGKFE